MPGIRFTGLRATAANNPLEKPNWSSGGHYPGTSKTIIEVETDQGPVGLGEAPSVDVVESIRAKAERLIVSFWRFSRDAGIAVAGDFLMSAAMPWITEPSQSLFRWQVGEVISGEQFVRKNNVTAVPEGPGRSRRLPLN